MKNQKLSIHTSAGWNKAARETNTKSFIHVFGREPRNYDEVKKWVDEAASGLDPEPKPEERFEIINGKVWSVRSFV